MFRRVVIALLFINFYVLSSVHAQYTSRLGRFQVDEVKGCAPFTVTILDTNLITTGECVPGRDCLMSAGNGTPPQPNKFTIIYPQAGTYLLSILYTSIGTDDITITVEENIQPEFEIYSCAGLKTSIKITNKSYDQYFIDFNNDGAIEVSMPNGNNQTASHTYNAAGVFNISVKGKDMNAANNCNAKVQPFTALTTLPVPQLSALTAVDETNLKLDYIPQANIQYKLEIAVNNASTFQQLQTLYAANTTNIPGLSVDNNYYCFRLGSYDPCLNSNTYSAPVCSQNFDLSIQSALNSLTWITSSAGINNIEILRDDNTLATIGGSSSAYADNSIVCKTQYCYQITSHYGTGVESTSLKKCGVSFTNSTPTAIENITSEVTATGVILNWKQDPAFSAANYTILRSQDNGPSSVFDQTNALTITDSGYTTESKTCYRINYLDVCDNNSLQGSLACPMRLTFNRDSKNAVILKWTGLRTLKNGVKGYRLQRLDLNGDVLSTINTGLDTTYTDNTVDLNNQIIQYKVLADANENGLLVSVSNQITVKKSTNLFYPTAFTPDNNGPIENETFNVSGQYIEKLELKIFDRWGNLVFFSDSNEPWDGTNQGKSMPEGTYVWIANITDKTGQKSSQHGTVVILRKVK